jgi:hypothetical protein
MSDQTASQTQTETVSEIDVIDSGSQVCLIFHISRICHEPWIDQRDNCF